MSRVGVCGLLADVNRVSVSLSKRIFPSISKNVFLLLNTKLCKNFLKKQNETRFFHFFRSREKVTQESQKRMAGETKNRGLQFVTPDPISVVFY